MKLERRGSADADFMPVVMSSLVTVGYNRFLFNVYDASYRQLASPDVAGRVDFYALERDPDTPAWRTGATYLSSGLGRGLYRTEVEFDCLGEWGAEVGRWRVDYSESEYFHILSGKSILHDEHGNALELNPGDKVCVPVGFRGEWEVVEPTRKVFVIYEP